MKKLFTIILLISFTATLSKGAATFMKISDYPRATTLGNNDLLWLAYYGGSSYTTNKSITYTNFITQLLTIIPAGSGTVYANGAAITNANFATSGNVTVNVSSVTNITFAIGALTDGNLAAGAGIARSKVAAGTANHLVINDSGGNLSSEAVVGAARFPALTGDVTTPGGSLATTIANNSVTYAKMQDVSATQRVLGRNSGGAGDTEEVSATQFLDWIGSTRGSILYRGASSWSILTPGTAMHVLTSNGAGADPSYQAPSGGTAVYVAGSSVTNPNFQSDQFAVNTSTNVVIKNAATITNVVNVGKITLTDAATIATDASLGNHFQVTLGGNRTLGNPTNPKNGQRAIWELIQDGTGSRTITMDTKFAFGTDITGITLTTTASKRDFVTAIYDSTADKWYVVGFVRGY